MQNYKLYYRKLLIVLQKNVIVLQLHYTTQRYLFFAAYRSYNIATYVTTECFLWLITNVRHADISVLRNFVVYKCTYEVIMIMSKHRIKAWPVTLINTLHVCVYYIRI